MNFDLPINVFYNLNSQKPYRFDHIMYRKHINSKNMKRTSYCIERAMMTNGNMKVQNICVKCYN